MCRTLQNITTEIIWYQRCLKKIGNFEYELKALCYPFHNIWLIFLTRCKREKFFPKRGNGLMWMTKICINICYLGVFAKVAKSVCRPARVYRLGSRWTNLPQI